ncbi:CHAD domain-containing protein [Dulcicalothrix desertica]
MTKLQIEQSLDSNYEVLHSLRKQAKRLRSQMELFTEFYGSNYAEHLTEVKNVQNILGEIYNSDVLEDWLIDVFGKDFTENLPTLTNLLVDKRHQLWQQWVLTRKHHTQSDKRNQMYLAILHQL